MNYRSRENYGISLKTKVKLYLKANSKTWDEKDNV